MVSGSSGLTPRRVFAPASVATITLAFRTVAAVQPGDFFVDRHTLLHACRSTRGSACPRLSQITFSSGLFAASAFTPSRSGHLARGSLPSVLRRCSNTRRPRCHGHAHTSRRFARSLSPRSPSAGGRCGWVRSVRCCSPARSSRELHDRPLASCTGGASRRRAGSPGATAPVCSFLGGSFGMPSGQALGAGRRVAGGGLRAAPARAHRVLGNCSPRSALPPGPRQVGMVGAAQWISFYSSWAPGDLDDRGDCSPRFDLLRLQALHDQRVLFWAASSHRWSRRRLLEFIAYVVLLRRAACSASRFRRGRPARGARRLGDKRHLARWPGHRLHRRNRWDRARRASSGGIVVLIVSRSRG